MAERVSDEALATMAAGVRGVSAEWDIVQQLAADLLAYRQAARALVEADDRWEAVMKLPYDPDQDHEISEGQHGLDEATDALRALVQADQEPTR